MGRKMPALYAHRRNGKNGRKGMALMRELNLVSVIYFVVS